MLKMLYSKKLNAFLILFLSNILLMIIYIVFNANFPSYVQLEQDLIFMVKDSVYSFAFFGFVFYVFTFIAKIIPPHIIGGGYFTTFNL